MSIDAIRYAWPEILIRAKAALPPVADLLDGVRAQSFDAGRLVVALPQETANPETVLTPDRLGVLARATEQETGLDVLMVSLRLAGGELVPSAPAKESKPKAKAKAEPDPESEPESKKKKEKPAPRDPLAELEGEQVRYQLMIPPPEGEPAQEMVPWWERRPLREKIVREHKAARAKEEAAGKLLVRTDPAFINSAEEPAE